MKKNLLLLGLTLSGSIAAYAQLNLPRPTVATPNHNGIEQTGTNAKPVSSNSEKAVTCTDQVTYTQDGNIQANDEIFVGGTLGWSSLFQVYPVFTGEVTQVEFKARSLGATALPVQVSIHAINASNEPIGAPIGSVNVSVGTTAGQYTGTFTSPISVTDGFAIALWDPNGTLTDSLSIYVNPDGSGNNEGYSFLYHPDPGLVSVYNDFGANLNFPFLPTIKFDHADPTISATGSTTICEGNMLEVDINNGGTLSHYSHPVYNPDGIGYSVDFGDGSAPATTASASHTYSMSGTYTVEGTTTYIGWNSQCQSSPASLSATVEMAPTSFFSFDATGLSVEFNSLSVGETTYSWNFGDGGTASSPSPIHNYTADGTYTVELTVTGPCGSDLYFRNITIAAGQNGGDVGIEEQDGMHVAIAPNPSSDIVEVAFELNEASDVLITLLSTDGKRIEQKSSHYNAEGSIAFDLSSLNAGVYFLDILVNDKKITKQVVKL